MTEIWWQRTLVEYWSSTPDARWMRCSRRQSRDVSCSVRTARLHQIYIVFRKPSSHRPGAYAIFRANLREHV